MDVEEFCGGGAVLCGVTELGTYVNFWLSFVYHWHVEQTRDCVIRRPRPQ